MDNLKIVYLPPDALTPYENNARRHGDDDVAAIMRSIEEFGFDDPIGVWGDDNVIVEGHGRLEAAKRLGMETVPCVRLDHLTEDQRKAYALAHNKTAELSGWDFAALEGELNELEGLFDMEDFGFDVDSYGDKSGSSNAQEDDFDEEDVPEEPRTKLGDIYILGRHRLMCGDSTDAETVQTLLDGRKVDMIFTDPPYNIDYCGVNDKRTIKNDKMSDDDFVEFLKKSFPPCDTAYVCCSWQNSNLFSRAMIEAGIPPKSMIVWNKVNAAQHLDKYFKQHELIFYSGKFGGEKTIRGDVWECKRQPNTVHPTMKPLELISMAINDNPGKKVIYDGFGGSGSTMMAAEQLGRDCYMMELDPHYCDVIVDRWEKFTGEKAVLLNE